MRGRGHPEGIGWQTTSFAARDLVNHLIQNTTTSISAAESPLLDQSFMSLLYLTGGRISEVLLLRERDFSDEEKYIGVDITTLKTRFPRKCKLCNKYAKSPFFHLKKKHNNTAPTKADVENFFDKANMDTKPKRRIYIPREDILIDYILRYRQKIKPEAELRNPALYNMRSYLLYPYKKVVFGWEWKVDYTKPMSAVSGWKIVKAHGDLIAAHIEEGKVFPHWFRHQRDSQLAIDGLSPFELLQFRGSTDLRSLLKYIHLMGKQYREKIKAG